MTLDALLRRNYDQIVDPVCKPLVLGFVRVTESVLDFPVDFIKRLTKVGTHLAKMDVAALEDAVLEQFFIYNLEGSFKIRRSDASSIPFSEYPIMQAHFESHAAYMAKLLYERTQEIRWMEQHFTSSCAAGDLASSYDPPYAAEAYAFAVWSAEVIFQATHEQHWVQSAYALAQKNLAYRHKHKINNVRLAELAVAKSGLDLYEFTGDLTSVRTAHELLQFTPGDTTLSPAQQAFAGRLFTRTTGILRKEQMRGE